MLQIEVCQLVGVVPFVVFLWECHLANSFKISFSLSGGIGVSPARLSPTLGPKRGGLLLDRPFCL